MGTGLARAQKGVLQKAREENTSDDYHQYIPKGKTRGGELVGKRSKVSKPDVDQRECRATRISKL